jgi:hypothetical protein
MIFSSRARFGQVCDAQPHRQCALAFFARHVRIYAQRPLSTGRGLKHGSPDKQQVDVEYVPRVQRYVARCWTGDKCYCSLVVLAVKPGSSLPFVALTRFAPTAGPQTMKATPRSKTLDSLQTPPHRALYWCCRRKRVAWITTSQRLLGPVVKSRRTAVSKRCLEEPANRPPPRQAPGRCVFGSKKLKICPRSNRWVRVRADERGALPVIAYGGSIARDDCEQLGRGCWDFPEPDTMMM